MSIYQELWDLDLQHNGCTVSNRDVAGNWINPDADILLDEQNESTLGPDQAPNPLFHKVNDRKLQGATYQALIKLLDNYVLNARLTEDHIGESQVEDTERVAFLDVISSTAVMVRAKEYISELGFGVVDSAFSTELVRIWFELYTNYFHNNPVPFCSGFEHVFVGEGKDGKNDIGGYHSWTKYYLDEKHGRVNFLGYNYDGNFQRRAPQGKGNPYVATIRMTWRPKNIHGNDMPTLTKDMGGFFVGPSPELQIALGTVAFYESLAGEYDKASRQDEKEIVLMDGRFRLVMYRDTTADGKRGNKIRSFFPKFVAPVASSDDAEVIPVVPGTTDAHNAGDVRIVRALVNPEGSDIGREWIDLESFAEQIIDLGGWRLEDGHKRSQRLLGQIEPRKTRRIHVTREDVGSLQLGNDGGVIRLLRGDDEVARVIYAEGHSGKVLFFVSAGTS